MADPGALTAQDGRVADITESLSRRQWDELTDIVLHRLERNIAAELARRGRLALPRGI